MSPTGEHREFFLELFLPRPALKQAHVSSIDLSNERSGAGGFVAAFWAADHVVTGKHSGQVSDLPDTSLTGIAREGDFHSNAICLSRLEDQVFHHMGSHSNADDIKDCP
ncbi:hypothetical protein D3C72_787820 [compost metagenome]